MLHLRSRPRREPARRPRAWPIVALIGVGACRESDEAKLSKLVDRFETHVYVGLKVAALDPERDSEVKEARRLIEELSTTTSTAGLDARDALVLGKAAWTLRSVGAKEVRRGRDSELPPLLPLLTSSTSIDRSTDHALLLLGLLALKVHPKAPVPVSNALLLYEAWMAGEAPLEPSLEPIVRAAQAYAMASSDLCDLASKFSDLLDKTPTGTKGDELARIAGMAIGMGHLAAHAPQEAGLIITLLLIEHVPWVLRFVAHVFTARCWDGRKNEERAATEWRRALDVAAGVGVPEAELSFLRAHLALRAGDLAEVKVQLSRAESTTLLDDAERTRLRTLVASIDPDEGKLEELLSSARIARFITSIVIGRLEAAGALDVPELKALDPARLWLGVVERSRQHVAGWSGWLRAQWEAL
ncbi:MAG: hypothetical protein HY791_02555 [Deltaproteobacteria bacterium]|nr:hypothetical protein [Deltaproteobacteria bacterium]